MTQHGLGGPGHVIWDRLVQEWMYITYPALVLPRCIQLRHVDSCRRLISFSISHVL
jgi:hypothetical protein